MWKSRPLLNDLAGSPVATDPVHLYLVPVGRAIVLPEVPPSNPHFALDQKHQVAPPR